MSEERHRLPENKIGIVFAAIFFISGGLFLGYTSLESLAKYPQKDTLAAIVLITFSALITIWGALIMLSLFSKSIKSTHENLVNKLNYLFEKFIVEPLGYVFAAAVLVIFIVIVLWGGNKMISSGIERTKELFNLYKWTLMVCETRMENGVDCFENSYEIPGFNSAKECLLEGTSRFSREGFECGKDCRKDGSLNICQEVCNARGCSE